MPSLDSEPCENHRIMGLGPTGTIVLSSSRRILFIDRKAIELLGGLEPGFPAGRGVQWLPSCLMTVVQEIEASHSSIPAGPPVQGARVCHLLGSPAQPVRVQGFTVPSPLRQERRIVLVLSEWAERAVKTDESRTSNVI